LNGWILIQQKLLTDTTNISFNRKWTYYRNGFGSFGGNYWLGNEIVYQLTNRANYKLRIEVRSTSNGAWTSAEYSSFYIDNEAANYKIHLSGYTGDGGDSMEYTGNAGYYNHNNMLFTTADRDNDWMGGSNCAVTHHGGWWYDACIWTLLNTDDSTQFYWQSLGDPAWFLNAARMMIKPV